MVKEGRGGGTCSRSRERFFFFFLFLQWLWRWGTLVRTKEKGEKFLIPFYGHCLLSGKITKNCHISSHRNSCKCKNTLVAVTGRGLEKTEGFDVRTWVLCDWGVREDGSWRTLVARWMTERPLKWWVVGVETTLRSYPFVQGGEVRCKQRFTTIRKIQ